MQLINQGFHELHALLTTFQFISNYDYFKNQVEEKWNIEMDKGLEKGVLEKLENPLFHEARYFLHQEIPTRSLFLNGSLILESANLEEYFATLLSQDKRALQEEVLQLLGFGLSLDSAKDNALPLIVEQLDALDFADDVKWFLMSLLQNPLLQLTRFKAIVDRFAPLYEGLREKYRPDYDAFCQWIEGELAENGVRFLDEHLNLVNVTDYDEIHLYYSLFDLFSSHHRGDGCIHLFVGILFQRHVQSRAAEQDQDTHLMTLKVLADQTRLDILRFLTTSESYGQEIAQQFGITTATVSYHMDYFLGASLIHMKRKGRRLYYSVNKSQIRDCLKFLEHELEL
jgi:DNA-binding transcriptional ArsR family regulator